MNFVGRGAVYIAERLFSSSLVAVVSRDNPRTLRVCHFNKGTEITSRKFDTKILSVKLNREVTILSSKTSKSRRICNPSPDVCTKSSCSNQIHHIEHGTADNEPRFRF